MKKYKLIRTATVSVSLNGLLKGQLSFIDKYFEVIALSGYDSNLEEIKKREKVRVINVAMERRIAPLKDIVSLIKLVKVFRKEKPLIVHSITPKAGLLTMCAGKIAGVPIRMHTFTGLIFPSRIGLMQKLLIKMDQLLCWAATNIYPEGQGVKKDLVCYDITSKPLKVLANGNVSGIDLDYFDRSKLEISSLNQLKNELGIKDYDFVYVFIGRLVGDKGINELVEAFTAIEREVGKNIKLLLVGPYETELDPLKGVTIENINNNKNIISVGFQRDVRPYFGISDVLVFPSYREGFPNVVIQAGALELPSIVTDISGCNEIVEEGVNGIIIPVKNIVAIKKAMLKLLDNKEYYNQLKSNCRSMIIKRYDQQLVRAALLEEYQTLVRNYENLMK